MDKVNNGGAPEWQDGECCFRCRTVFTVVSRKHHCRNCGNVFCARCSSQSTPIPKFGIDKSVRVCDDCFDRLTNKQSSGSDSASVDKSSQSTASNGSVASVTTTASKTKASAPSETEMREEEELQLALALSLSEALPTTRPSLPAASATSVTSSTPTNSSSNQTVIKQVASNASVMPSYPSTVDIVAPITSVISNTTTTTAAVTSSSTEFTPTSISLHSTDTKVISSAPQSEQQSTVVQTLTPVDAMTDEQEFAFIAELQSNIEVFTNRIDSNKLRGRPIRNDTSIQSLFMTLTTMHSRLLELIKKHDDERVKYEDLQDKISQINDARAALNALREEHQEKIRLEAAEAERTRQSQLAHKLELMRQKKAELLQYQRDLAMQRIQEQENEMMMRLQQQQQQHQQQQSTQQQSLQSQPELQPPQLVDQQQQHLQMQATAGQPMMGHAPVNHTTNSYIQYGDHQAVGVPTQVLSGPSHMFASQTHTSGPDLAYQQAVAAAAVIASSTTGVVSQTPTALNNLNVHQLQQQQQLPPQQQAQAHPIQAPVIDEAPLISFDD